MSGDHVVIYLICPPDHFSPLFLSNPWLRWNQTVDPSRAQDEWEGLRRAIEDAEGRVAVIRANREGGMMCFTRDAALSLGRRRILLLRGAGGRGIVEPPQFGRWFRRAGFRIETLPRGHRLEGGNVVRLGDGRTLVGIEPASDGRGVRHLARRLRPHRSIGIPLRSRRFGHLDRTLADLDGRGWLVHRGGLGSPDLDDPAWRAVRGGRRVVEVDAREAARLACNVLVVNGVVIAGWLSPRLRRAIGRLGLETVVTPLGEFRKAGGGARCLTLEIDA